MEIVSRKTNEISPAKYNPRTITKDEIQGLKESIKKFGFVDPLIVNKRTGNLIGGHQRLKVAEALEMESVPTVEVDLSLSEEKALNVALNSQFISGKYDDKILNELLGEIKDDLPELYDDLRFDELETEAEQVPSEGLTDDDAVPEVKESITKRGDIWLLGNHRVMCGDSTMIDDVDKLMKGERADMVFTDPPYNQETQGGRKGAIGGSFEKQGKSIEHISNFNPDDFLKILPTVFNKNMNAYIFTGKNLLPEYLGWARDNKYAFNILIWKKPNAIPIGGSHRPDIEYILLFRRSGTFNGGLKDVNYSKLLEHGREFGLHPTMKPVKMIENQLMIGSNKKSIVVDLFLGSGSTLIACEKTNRKCYGMELDEHYCDVIVNRWQDFTGKEVTLESNGKKYNELKNASS